MKRPSHALERSPFAVVETRPAQRTVERETLEWEQLHEGEESQLPAEYASALSALATHPYLGSQLRRRGHYRKLYLRRTGFFILYRLMPRRRIVVVVALVAKRSLAHRR
ncbi:MAG TPA: hypothetical protein VIV11_27310 [Kofleriaceae bacterium]